MKVDDIQKLNKRKKPIVVFNDDLNIHRKDIPFPEKIEAANEMLRKNNFFTSEIYKELLNKH